MSLLISPIVGAKGVFNDAVKNRETFVLGSDHKIYAFGAGLPQIMNDGERLLPNKKFQTKLGLIAARAFEQCEDQSNNPALPHRTKTTITIKIK